MPAVAAVDAEVGVRGEEEGVGEDFGYPDDAGVGEAHGDIGVFFHEDSRAKDPVARASASIFAAGASGIFTTRVFMAAVYYAPAGCYFFA